MFAILISTLLQLGLITTSADFQASNYDEVSQTYQGQSIIITDDLGL